MVVITKQKAGHELQRGPARKTQVSTLVGDPTITDAVPFGRTIGNAERFECWWWANRRVPGSAYGCLRQSLILAKE